MTITLYKCANDPDTLNKTFSNSSYRNGTPYEPVDDLNGYVILDYTVDIESYNAASLIIGNRTKYYTITSRTPEPGHKVRVNLSCDVLETYKTEIENISGILSRTADKDYNAFVVDNKATFQANFTTVTVPLDTITYDSSKIILAVIGCNKPETENQMGIVKNFPNYQN